MPDADPYRRIDPDIDRSDESDDSFVLPSDQIPAALEALLFAAGDPLPLEKIQQITGLERTLLVQYLNALSERIAQNANRGLLLREIEGHYFLCTKPEMKDLLQRLYQPRHRPPLSQAAYETLAVIAYNQPVTRAQVEAVRGVNSDSIIIRLIERNLIEETGHLDSPGRPLLYATTKQFLMDFGLRSVQDLPPMEMMMYQTLQDFETTLEEASGRKSDRQISIDQLIDTVRPPADKPEQLPDPDSCEAVIMSDDTVLAVSEVLFGDERESAERMDDATDRSESDQSGQEKQKEVGPG